MGLEFLGRSIPATLGLSKYMTDFRDLSEKDFHQKGERWKVKWDGVIYPGVLQWSSEAIKEVNLSSPLELWTFKWDQIPNIPITQTKYLQFAIIRDLAEQPIIFSQDWLFVTNTNEKFFVNNVYKRSLLLTKLIFAPE